MANTMTYTSTLSIHECPTCAITYAIPEDFDRRKRNDGGSWYCPNGHSISYTKSELDKLREQLKRAQENRDWAETARKAALDQAQTAEYRRRAAAGQVTRIKNRVANGVCPCCKRTFADLAAHMTTKHPDFQASPGE